MSAASQLPPFDAYSDDDPVAFYLSSAVRAELEAGADAVCVCEGRWAGWVGEHIARWDCQSRACPVQGRVTQGARRPMRQEAGTPRAQYGRIPPTPPSSRRALPVHSAVLSVASGALRDFFDAKAAAAAQANGDGGGVLHSLGSAPHLGSSYMLSSSGAHLDVSGEGWLRSGVWTCEWRCCMQACLCFLAAPAARLRS